MYIIKRAKEVAEILDALGRNVREGNANADEQKLYKKLKKTLGLLAENPRHPGLASHKIHGLSARYHCDIWESYVENHTPGAMRVFWRYGPGANVITLLQLERHPENALPYQQVALKMKREEADKRP